MIVRQFLQWIETAPVRRRAEAAHALARAYLYSDVEDADRDGMEAAMTVLLDDSAPEVRLSLADALATDERAPRHIVLALAADQPDIAALVLTLSPVFIDAELVDIAAAAETSLQIAVALRQPLSSAVAAAIAEVGEAEACLALLGNEGATVASISLRRIGERFGDHGRVREALLARDDLPVDVRQSLIRQLGDMLGSLVAGKSWMGEARAMRVTRDACDRATVALAAETATEEIPALVEHLRVTGQLTTALLLRTLCAGNVAFFEAALAILAGVPEERVESVVRTGRAAGLRAIYHRAGLPPVAFEAIAAALAVAVEHQGAEEGDRYRIARHTVDEVLARYRAITDGEMNELLAMLRRFAADEARERARAYALSCIEAA